MQYSPPYKILFFPFCVFLYIIHPLNVVRAIKKMPVNEIRDFIFENHYSMKHLKRKDLLLLANKVIVKLPDFRNAKQHYKSF